jgi:DNA invertase Pin-like site-specific DNA recombinase
MNPNASKPSLGQDRKISTQHLERLAIVYVRQSTLQQVQNHQESTRLQYGLVEHAQLLGWSRERILVIDDDLGKSGSHAVGREGFQRLVTEVGLNHVGLILGIEMSRLARSNRDWHHLLEVCALFRTLIADADGVYDPAQYNDRLLLGLKGTMSEAELHVLRGRLFQGKLSKARRGELGGHTPIGYTRDLQGAVQFDPDEQVQDVVKLIFRKFEEFGTLNAVLQYLVRNDIKLGVRDRNRNHRTADGAGQLEWHRPNRMTLQNLLHHPMYAGAYSYGRRQIDQRKQDPNRPSTGRVVRPVDEWHVLLRDHLPAYISWEQHQNNLARLNSNRSLSSTPGAARNGSGLLSGLLRCGKCGRRMSVGYFNARTVYSCANFAINYGGTRCLHLVGRTIEAWVSEQALIALEPASLELSLETLKHLELEREALERVWQQKLERARFEVGRAKRQYDAVEPEHRLVVRQLERTWEEKLINERREREVYEQFLHAQPRNLTAAQIEAIRQLAQDVPALWHAPQTTARDRKEILRLIIERITVNVEGQSERTQVRIEWVGGAISEGEVARPIAQFAQLSYYPTLLTQLEQAIKDGLDAAMLAESWNSSGLKPPKRVVLWTGASVRAFARSFGWQFQRGSDGRQVPALRADRVGDWWTVRALAVRLQMPQATLYRWLTHEFLTVRRTPDGRGWEVWADDEEFKRLRVRRAEPVGVRSHDAWVLRAARLSESGDDFSVRGGS